MPWNFKDIFDDEEETDLTINNISRRQRENILSNQSFTQTTQRAQRGRRGQFY